ncbi:hypothetical protein [Nostoc sp. FACHB-888]|jgi:hypothetical protein|uniref:hypothetical protein n=1 Tax=Nostoc sp. FACHB-888 TaxID=2692842 RepID=UPI00168968E2|nr:hypothetical protein [Nostoc sp. FACHB-888]MBD2246394.1 hypothetical protein [Nostoc sp. FACHB-888]MBW4454791.1 hypothetical protein [Nostoc indistinguendum CM1-VF10]MCC5649497.1 hypothetical protein [Nostoc sp. XA013]
MINLISRTIANISSLLKGLQVKSFLAVVVVGFLVLTTNVSDGPNDKGLKERVRQQVEQNDAERPKTIGQWFKDARETEDSPGERLQKIGQQSGEAFKEFGSGYVKGAQETASDVGDSAAEAARDVSNKVGR